MYYDRGDVLDENMGFDKYISRRTKNYFWSEEHEHYYHRCSDSYCSFGS